MKKIKKICEFCHKEFETRFLNQRFCSRKCFGKSKITSIAKTCLNCGKQFAVIPSINKDGKGKYCSKECYLQAVKNGRIKNKGWFKQGHKGYRNKGNFKKGNIPWNKGKRAIHFLNEKNQV